MPKYYATRFYDARRDGKKQRPITELMMADQLGKHVPLLDQNGEPVNFERKPMALERAFKAMNTMDTIFDDL